MICQTVRKGHECFLMKSDGCSAKDGECYPIIDKCQGCAKVVDVEGQEYCLTYPYPEAKWQGGICVMATHVKRNVEEIKQKINPLKASKRGANR